MEEIWYTYSNGTKVLAYEYEYTTYGQVYKRTDHLTDNTTVYKYDDRQRLVGVYEHSDDLEYSFNTVYSYDLLSQLTEKENYIDLGTRSISQSTEYTYDDDGKLLSENYGTGSLTYEYDPYNRLKKTVLYSSAPDDENSTVIESTYVYRTHLGNTTDGLISSYVSTVGDTSTVYTYEYDDRGYITKITVGDKEIRYTYDSLGQLVREDNELTNTTTIIDFWISGGNYTNKSVYELTDEPYENLPYNSQVEAHVHSGDRIIVCNGVEIQYDALGNPLNSYAHTYTWNGRRLVGVTENHSSNVYSFTYNDDGIRTSKTKNGIKTTYYLNGAQIVGEETSGNITLYIYDAKGTPVGFRYHASTYAEGVYDEYWFEKSVQGDILAVYDDEGKKMVAYSYDAWGKPSVTNYTGATTAAKNNPFTYRGYYYDKDLELYYLNSRYYDAKVCRFVNADNYLHRDINGNNSYCYCGNNPVTRVDETGNWWWFIGAAVGAVVGAVSKVVSNVVTGKNWNEGIVGAAVGGAVSGSIAATTGNLAAASFAGAAVESAVNELLSYTEISTNINAIEKKELTVENVQNSLETVATDTVVNGLVSLCASQISGKIIKMNSGWFKPQKLASCLFGTYARKAHLQTIIEGAFSSFSNVILPFDKLQENYQKPIAPVFP